MTTAEKDADDYRENIVELPDGERLTIFTGGTNDWTQVSPDRFFRDNGQHTTIIEGKVVSCERLKKCR